MRPRNPFTGPIRIIVNIEENLKVHFKFREENKGVIPRGLPPRDTVLGLDELYPTTP